MSRIIYENGKVFISHTREEAEGIYENIGRPYVLPIGQLKILHEDINKAVLNYWKDQLKEGKLHE